MAGDLVLLTGGTGMIGFRVLSLLLKDGYQVRVAVRNEAGFERIKGLKSVAPYTSQINPIIVPDITVKGAYDEALQGGVKQVIHVASPLAHPGDSDADYDAHLVDPAVKGTIGMLESAAKVSSVNRIVLTASILSISTLPEIMSGKVINENCRATRPEGPFSDLWTAYSASKALAYQATEELVAENKPPFDIINIEPVFVIGRDETVTKPTNIVKGTNGLVMGPALGYPQPGPTPGKSVHIDDVAMMHVRSLNRTIVPASENFLASCNPPQGIVWGNALDILAKHYSTQCADGIFKLNTERLPSGEGSVDSSKAEKTFGFTFKSFEEQVLSVASHYLELLDQV